MLMGLGRRTGKVTYYTVDVLFVFASDTSLEMMMMLGVGKAEHEKNEEEVNSMMMMEN